MARSDIHGEILATAERSFRDERQALVRETVRLMADGTVLARTTKTGDITDPTTWTPSGRWKRVTHARLPAASCTDAVAQWILAHPEKAAACRKADELVRKVRWHEEEHRRQAASSQVSAETRQAVRSKADASRENGAKGGRPHLWSQEALVSAVGALRHEAERLPAADSQQMLRLAQAVEDGTFRSRTRL